MQQTWGRGPRGGCRAAGRLLVFSAVLAGVIGACSLCSAQTYYWNPNGLNSPGGSGVWDITTTEWSQSNFGGNDVAWPNSGSPFYYGAEFGGPGGTVTLNSNSTSLYTRALTFDSAYTINGPSAGTAGLIFNNGSSIYLRNGVNNVTINANLSGAYGFSETGAGALTLGGDNSGLYGLISLSGNVNLAASTAGSANAAWTLNGVALSYNPSVGGTGKIIQLGSLAGSGTLTNSGTAGPSDVTTFAIGALGTSTTFSGSIADSAAGDRTALSLSGGSASPPVEPTFTLTGSSTYTGPTVVTGSALRLEGTSGTVAGSRSITLSVGGIPVDPRYGPFPGSLIIDNSASGNNNDRISDAAAITFEGGTFTYTGSGSTASSETIGAISLNGGYNTIAIKASTYPATINAASLSRPAFGGTAFISGLGLSLAAPPPLVGGGPITNGYTPTEHNAPIVPFLVGYSGISGATQPNTFMTYGRSGGLRPLDAGNEFTSNAVVAGDNTRISANTTASSSATINSLTVLGASLTIGAGTTLNVASGAVLIYANPYNAAIVGADPNSSVLAFGGGEAIVGAFGEVTPVGIPTAMISANLANLTGLTISGSWMLNLTQGTGTTDTAPIYIQSGGLAVSQDVNLGYVSGPNAITFPVGSTGWLRLTGTAFSTSTKGISLQGIGNLSVAQANESASIGSVISGPGILQKAGSGTLTLANAANTYTGTTAINGGTLALAANSNNNIPGSRLIFVGSKSTGGILDATQLTAPGGFQLRPGQTLTGFGTVEPPHDGLVVGPDSVITAGDGVSATGNLTTAGTQVWNGGGTYVWKLGLSGVGTSGTLNTSKSGNGWDQLTMNALVVTATAANPFNIEVLAVPGFYPTNPQFDPRKSYSWVAASMPAGQQSGSPASALKLSFSGFSNYDMATGSFFGAFDSTSDPGFTDLIISYSPAPEPSAAMLLCAGAGSLLLKRRRAANGSNRTVSLG